MVEIAAVGWGAPPTTPAIELSVPGRVGKVLQPLAIEPSERHELHEIHPALPQLALAGVGGRLSESLRHVDLRQTSILPGLPQTLEEPSVGRRVEG